MFCNTEKYRREETVRGHLPNLAAPKTLPRHKYANANKAKLHTCTSTGESP